MKDFFKATLRATVAFFLALIGLAIAIELYSWAIDSYDKQQAKPFEEVRNWKFDLKDSVGVEAKAKTKLVGGTLLASVEIIGYPKYFSDPRNANASLIFEFLDKDGFRIISKAVQLAEFTTVVGKNGEKTGLGYQFEEHADIGKYKRFDRMQVGWNLITEAAPIAPDPKPMLDHCAPNISKAERLKRLGQYGTVRETGTGDYSAAGRSVYFHFDGSLGLCR